MSHPQQQAFVARVRERHQWAFSCTDENLDSRRVLDVGALDINGNNREHFAPDTWMLGIDVAPGPNVDLVAPCHMLTFRDGFFDTIISTEAFEHDAYLPLTLRNIVRMLAPGGLFVFTCATTGRGEHGTVLSKPHDAPGLPWWHYRNVTEQHMRMLLPLDAFSEVHFEIGHETCDLYGYMVKR